jgi:hypothetical protein
MKRCSWFKPMALTIVVALVAVTSGCADAASQAKRKPIYNDLKVVDIPAKLVKKTWPKGTIVGITKEKPAPFSGILLNEKRAKSVGQLRIAYDHLYDVASINRKFTLTVLKEADNRLSQADAEIRRLRKKQNTWWARNRTWILLLSGSVFTMALGGLALWGVTELKK